MSGEGIYEERRAAFFFLLLAQIIAATGPSGLAIRLLVLPCPPAISMVRCDTSPVCPCMKRTRTWVSNSPISHYKDAELEGQRTRFSWPWRRMGVGMH